MKLAAIKGGEFLIRAVKSEDIFIPEDFTDEAIMMGETCREFIKKEVLPLVEAIDRQTDELLVPQLLDKAGALGLLATALPENYGGLALPFTTTMLVTEEIGRGYSFAVALSAHTGIGTLPILYYGSDAQKEKYLPKLATGEVKASYCLTEPNAGSDANSGKTKAVLNTKGTHYLITGQKMWITNAGFANLFIVFAKIDADENLTAFIVERGFGNITMNEEEHKMGIKGSSTRQVFFNETPVPIENMLSTRGEGFKIAVNILNIGRIKLAAAAYGVCKTTLEYCTQYANQRVQFGKPIAAFGAIKHKVAQMAIKIFVSESAAYRAAHDIETKIAALESEGISASNAKLIGTEQFAIECAILKVHASEILDYVVDEGVQIYGGMGFSAEAPMERMYRDSRINRIFEGTNEINRLLIVNMLVRRTLKGELDLGSAALKISKEIIALPIYETAEGFLKRETKAIENLKKAFLLIAGAVIQQNNKHLEEEQELLMALADMVIEIYTAESALLRIDKIVANKPEHQELLEAIAIAVIDDAATKCRIAGETAINSFAVTDNQSILLIALSRFSKISPVNTVAARRTVAQYVLNGNHLRF
jgi:alkylation response protein AidB-like acyl-CoA dehydrogenase